MSIPNRCIWCGGEPPDTTFNVSHVLPECVGNENQQVLPVGIVCERCNNYFGTQVEPLQQAILYMCRTQKSRYGDDFMGYVLSRRECGWKPEVPDVAVDQHTERGRKKGRGEIFFCQEGAEVSNEVKIEGPNYWGMYCEMCKNKVRCPVREKIEARGKD